MSPVELPCLAQTLQCTCVDLHLPCNARVPTRTDPAMHIHQLVTTSGLFSPHQINTLPELGQSITLQTGQEFVDVDAE